MTMDERIYEGLKKLYIAQDNEQYLFCYSHTRANALIIAKRYQIVLNHGIYYEHEIYMKRFVEEMGMIAYYTFTQSGYEIIPLRAMVKQTIGPIKKFMIEHNMREPIMLIRSTVYLSEPTAVLIKLTS